MFQLLEQKIISGLNKQYPFLKDRFVLTTSLTKI